MLSNKQPKLNHVRSVPLEVLVMGLPRTGTTSIRAALLELGYFDVHHMRVNMANGTEESVLWIKAFDAKFGGKGKPFDKSDWDYLLGNYMATTDAPSVCFAEELIALYPNAKVVLTVRDNPEVWCKSTDETIWRLAKIFVVRKKNPVWDFIYFSLLPKAPVVGDVVATFFKYTIFGDFGYAKGKKYYEEHNEMIRQIMRDNGRPLLEFNAKQGWKPLCDFLGKTVPSTPYPRANTTEIFHTRFPELLRNPMVLIGINLLKYGGVAGIFGAAAWLVMRWRSISA